MRFSQRVGKTPIEKLVQHERVDDDLRNSLWSAITFVYFDHVRFARGKSGTKNSNLAFMFYSLWADYLKEPIDLIPYRFSNAVSLLRESFFAAKWYELFDFVEAVSKSGPEEWRDDFVNLCNEYLIRENSAYRFVNYELSEITSKIEINEVENAINNSGVYSGTKKHLETALVLMNDRSNPDYRNSIKESISAVESLAKIVSGEDKATLGKALNTIEKNAGLHQALKSAFSSLYGYTNDTEGIRHALMDESTLSKADAKFMLVSCSAFVNYLIELSNN